MGKRKPQPVVGELITTGAAAIAEQSSPLPAGVDVANLPPVLLGRAKGADHSEGTSTNRNRLRGAKN